MSRVKTELVKSNGKYCVKFYIDHQSFTLDNNFYDSKTSRKDANWFKNQLDIAFERLLNSENTEGVSTTSCTESGDLHDVSDRNASRSDSTEDSEVVVEGALALRTDTERAKCHKKDMCYCDPYLSKKVKCSFYW